jgi:glycerol-3-phosphate dehydrogenase
MTHVDILIIGGGIAGLWTLARLRRSGYDAWLVESSSIGGIQSIASQGIIHGGTKYALGGKLGDSAKAIGDMPRVWNDCLDGTGEVDLSGVEIHTKTQLMWSTRSAVSRVAGFFAGKLMEDRMSPMATTDYPAPFNHAAFDGVIYQLNEPVLNTASLMSELYQQLSAFCFKGNVILNADEPTRATCQDPVTGKSLKLNARQIVLAAGESNESLLRQLHRRAPVMQRRPVHMALLKSRQLPAVYAHCLSASANPRLTITSTRVDDATCWYVGGNIAETGIHRNREQQIQACQKELQEVLPWIDFQQCEWSALMINRAEIQMPGNKRPDSCYVDAHESVITAWPTKLAFAPRVASEVIGMLAESGLMPSEHQSARPEWPEPELATWPWLNTQWS